jgi:hypothetical protein
MRKMCGVSEGWGSVGLRMRRMRRICVRRGAEDAEDVLGWKEEDVFGVIVREDEEDLWRDGRR